MQFLDREHNCKSFQLFLERCETCVDTYGRTMDTSH